MRIGIDMQLAHALSPAMVGGRAEQLVPVTAAHVDRVDEKMLEFGIAAFDSNAGKTESPATSLEHEHVERERWAKLELRLAALEKGLSIAPEGFGTNRKPRKLLGFMREGGPH